MKNRRFWLILSVLSIAAITFLTFQSRNNTEALSNSIKDWLYSIGISISGKRLRSDAHIIEHCVLGIALSEYGFICNKKFEWIISVGFCLGLLDELLRIVIPTREFELTDLIKDWIGIVLGIIIVCYFHKEKYNRWFESNNCLMFDTEHVSELEKKKEK